MTRDRESHRVRRAGARDRANSLGPADRRRDVTVRARLAIRDCGERLPDLPLERRRLNVERQIDMRALSLDMFQDSA